MKNEKRQRFIRHPDETIVNLIDRRKEKKDKSNMFELFFPYRKRIVEK